MGINSKNDVILNSLAEGVITVDKDFKITFINEAAEKITGFEKNQILGKFCRHVFKSDFCSANCPIANVLHHGKNVYDIETSINCNNSEPIPVKLNAAILKDENALPIGGVISFRDISLIKKVESMLNTKNIFMGMIGVSKKMREVFQLIEWFSVSDVPVLIHGETGTGKELVANAIKTLSKRNDKNFVKVNCSVIPQNLIGSELFGHAKGAFTDAHRDRIGRFEYADGGTIFLDEIGELPLQMQPQLLRVIEDGSFERIGETITKNVDVRIISATNVNLEEAIKSGRFRQDLFYRLNTATIELPPLRERKEDIPLLIEHFLNKYSIVYKRNINSIDDNALEILVNWNWPGNIRELENTIEFALIRTKSNKICMCCLPQKIRGNLKCSSKVINTQVEISENNAQLVDLLNQYKWNKTKVASILGINRTTLWRKLKSIGIE